MTGAELDALQEKVREALKELMPPDIVYFAAFFEGGSIDCKILSNIKLHEVGNCLRIMANQMDKTHLVTRN